MPVARSGAARTQGQPAARQIESAQGAATAADANRYVPVTMLRDDDDPSAVLDLSSRVAMRSAVDRGPRISRDPSCAYRDPLVELSC